MIETLLGLPGRVSALLGRLTETRANNLDRLDAAVTTRAPSATALSNLVWTDAIATKLAAMHVDVPPTSLPASWNLPNGITVAAAPINIDGYNDSFFTIYSRAGSGYVNLIAFSWLMQIEIVIDGIVVRSESPSSDLRGIWGSVQGTVFAPAEGLFFNTSLVIKARRNTAGANTSVGKVYLSVVGT